MTAFGELVAQMVGLDVGFTSSTVLRWEEGAEPGLVAGCAIAALGDVSPDTLAFQDVAEDAHPAEGRVIPHNAYRPAEPEAAPRAAEEPPARKRGRNGGR